MKMFNNIYFKVTVSLELWKMEKKNAVWSGFNTGQLKWSFKKLSLLTLAKCHILSSYSNSAGEKRLLLWNISVGLLTCCSIFSLSEGVCRGRAVRLCTETMPEEVRGNFVLSLHISEKPSSSYLPFTLDSTTQSGVMLLLLATLPRSHS